MAYESIVPPPGPLLARGRSADVYDVGDGQVLRRYRRSSQDTAYEIRVMRFVAGQGIRVPAVFDLGPKHLADRDILMERIDGTTMREDFQAPSMEAFLSCSFARSIAARRQCTRRSELDGDALDCCTEEAPVTTECCISTYTR